MGVQKKGERRMIITELQNEIKVYRVQDDGFTEEIIMILEEGEPRFYSEIDIKYSYFESCLKKEGEELIQIGDVDDLEEAYGDLYKEIEQ